MYTLINGVKMNKENPDTFEIPSLKEIYKLAVGTYVKLGFEEEGKPAERMWVKLTKVGDYDLKGTLDNKPYELTTIQLGDQVTFNAKHILAIMEEESK